MTALSARAKKLDQFAHAFAARPPGSTNSGELAEKTAKYEWPLVIGLRLELER